MQYAEKNAPYHQFLNQKFGNLMGGGGKFVDRKIIKY